MDLDEKYRYLFHDVSPSVVIVEQIGRVAYFCVGSVILNEDEATFILTQSSILNANVNLSVRFSDSVKQPATTVLNIGKFCILKTALHKSKAVEFFEGSSTHSDGAIIAPASKTSVYNLSGSIVNNLNVLCDDDGQLIDWSKHTFVFDSRYGEQSPNGENRSISGPVFNMDSKTLGFIYGDMKYNFHPKSVIDGEHLHDDLFVEMGYRYKVVLKASYLPEMLRPQLGDDWKKGLRLLAKVD